MQVGKGGAEWLGGSHNSGATMTVRQAGFSLGALCILGAVAACDSTKPSPPPIAVVQGTYAAVAGEPIQFDGTASSDPSGSDLTYDWDLGNGAVATGPTPTYTYNEPGAYDVTLVVTNTRGRKSAPAATLADIAPWVNDTLAKDVFDREVQAGWGNAEMGGEWQWKFPGPDDVLSVSGGAGRITKSDVDMRNVALSGGYGLDVEGVASFSIDRAPDAPNAFYTVQVYARRDDSPEKGFGNNQYRFRVIAEASGAMHLAMEKEIAAATSFVTEGDIGIAEVWEPGVKYWIRWQVAGTSPSTALRMRVWRDGTPEPGEWQLDITHDDPALDFPGATGFRVEGPNVGQSTWPVTFSFDDLVYRKL